MGRFLGWAEREKEEGERFCIFLRRNKHIQLKFEFKEFKFKLKLKQINNAPQHECNTNKKTLFNLENNKLLLLFSNTKFPVKKINVGENFYNYEKIVVLF